MNNKGQSLALFVIIIPIILFFLMIVADYGLISIEKRHIDNSIKDSIKFGLNNINNDNIDNKIKVLIYKNIDINDIKDIKINIIDNTITIDIEVKINTIFNILNIKNNIKASYIGKIVDNNIQIIKR